MLALHTLPGISIGPASLKSDDPFSIAFASAIAGSMFVGALLLLVRRPFGRHLFVVGTTLQTFGAVAVIASRNSSLDVPSSAVRVAVGLLLVLFFYRKKNVVAYFRTLKGAQQA